MKNHLNLLLFFFGPGPSVQRKSTVQGNLKSIDRTELKIRELRIFNVWSIKNLTGSSTQTDSKRVLI